MQRVINQDTHRHGRNLCHVLEITIPQGDSQIIALIIARKF